MVPMTHAVSMISLSDCIKGLYYLSDNRAGLRTFSSLDTMGKLRTVGNLVKNFGP